MRLPGHHPGKGLQIPGTRTLEAVRWWVDAHGHAHQDSLGRFEPVAWWNALFIELYQRVEKIEPSGGNSR